jgi:hypothetical protein
VVEFNTVVGTSVAGGTTLTSSMVGSANSTTTAAVTDYINTETPTVTLAKQVESITYNPDGSATITYVDTVTDTGDAPAYNVSLTDPGTGTGTPSYTGTHSGTGTVTAAGTSGTGFSATLSSLPTGGSESFTYTVTIPPAQVTTAVADSATKATATWQALNPTQEVGGKDVLSGTSVTPTTYSTTAEAGLDLVSGNINQDLSPTEGTDTPLQGLAGQTVSVSFNGQVGSETVTSASDGSFVVLVPDSGVGVTISVTPSGSNVPANDVLDNTPSNAASLSGLGASSDGLHTGSASLSFGSQPNASYTGIAFDFWTAPDTAPVLANGPGSATIVTPGESGVVLFPSATVADTQLDNSFGHDFSGTTLTIQRYVSGAADPNANDSFTGNGTSTTGVFLNTTNHEVLLNGTEVGTFTENGGKLSISFLSTGITATTVDTVLQGVAYSFTGASNSFVPGAIIGVQIDDANNDPISLNSAPLDPSGPHDQGIGGDLLSNVLTATVNVLPVAPLTPSLTVVGESNDTAGLGTQFDPTGTVSPGVLTTDGEIVRMRSTLQLPVGDDSNVTMTVTLPTGLTYSNDGTVTILLVSPNGDTATSLTGSGLQLAEGSTAANTGKLDLGTGGDTTDPVTVTLPAADISYNSATNTITFSLGNLSNKDVSELPSYAVVEFNTVVGTSVAGGTTLTSSMVGSANSTTTAAVTDYINTQAPSVSLNKQIESITYNPDGSATITYVDTVTDTGDGPAYNVAINDPGTGTGTASYTGTHSGTGTGANGSTSGGSFNATVSSLPTGGSESFTYTVTIPPGQIGEAVADSNAPATATSQALNPAHEVGGQDVLAGTSVTPATSSAHAAAGLALVSGTVNEDLGTTEGSDNPLQGLSGQTVTVTYPGQVGTETVTTNANGGFTVLVPTTGVPVSITATVGGNTLLTSTVLDNNPSSASSLTGTGAVTTGTNPATLTFTPAANLSYTALTFDFWAEQVLPPINPNPPPEPPYYPTEPYPDDSTPSFISDLSLPSTDDWWHRPLIPDLSLVGSVENRFIIVEQRAIIEVPSDIFVDTLPNPDMTYEAKLPDGTPLPYWLTFDANNLTFYGIPPANAFGRLEITITARDFLGQTAEASFTILIGRRENDLARLLTQGGDQDENQTGGFHPYGFQTSAVSPIATPGSARAIQLAESRSVHHRDVIPAERAQPSVRIAGHVSDTAGFSAALRAASNFGALARARALLDGLQRITSPNPPI